MAAICQRVLPLHTRDLPQCQEGALPGHPTYLAEILEGEKGVNDQTWLMRAGFIQFVVRAFFNCLQLHAFSVQIRCDLMYQGRDVAFSLSRYTVAQENAPRNTSQVVLRFVSHATARLWANFLCIHPAWNMALITHLLKCTRWKVGLLVLLKIRLNIRKL